MPDDISIDISNALAIARENRERLVDLVDRAAALRRRHDDLRRDVEDPYWRLRRPTLTLIHGGASADVT